MVRLVSRVAALILLAGCAKQKPADGAVERDTWPGTREELTLYRALSLRDGAPSCDELDAMVSDPVASFTWIAEDVPQPPWAGIRAATCLALLHADEAQDTLRSWVVDPNRRGLAVVTLQGVDEMPEEVAVEIVRDALAGPFAAEAEEAAAGSERPAVRALLP